MNKKTLRRLVLTGPAPWLEKERLRISLRAGRDSNQIRKALKGCGIELSRKSERIPSDLGDILECFRHIKLSIDSLTSRGRRLTKKSARAVLEQIRNDLYIHFSEHFRGLKKPLDKLIDELDEELGSRWDHLIQEFEGPRLQRRKGGGTPKREARKERRRSQAPSQQAEEGAEPPD